MTRASGKTKGMMEAEKKTIEVMRDAMTALSSVTTTTRSESGPVTWVSGSHSIARTVGGSAPDIISGGASAHESVSEPIYAESFLPHLVRAKEEGTRKKIEMDTVVIDRGVATSQGLEHADMILGLKVKYAKEGSLPMDSAFVIMKDSKAEAEKKGKEIEEKVRAITDAFKERMESEGREATVRADDSSSPSSSPSVSLLSDLLSPETLPLTPAPALTAGAGARFLVLERKFIDDSESRYGLGRTEGELLLAIDKIVGVEYIPTYEEDGHLIITYQIEDTTKTLSILTKEEQQRVLRVLKASRF